MAKQLKDAYGKYFKEMVALSHAPDKIDETNIYQEANPELTKYMDLMLNDNFLPESGLGNIENFKAFYDAVVKDGKKGLILMEHYTNLDLPAIIY
ncbi:MAG: 1-acyl-sn-glycerol-3-phosphate acyltransferase, partial [Treponema porcinum]|nr:1-acyl-sn-glycerol-3-phosphate acyltransferase [Treponema porcinum]